MPDRLSMHAPVLVNTLGHCAGAFVFGILLYLLLIEWHRDPEERNVLPVLAAALAVLWNAGSLVGLATAPGDILGDVIVAASFSVLSLLPAVLLHISMGPRLRVLTIAGYAASSLAVALHITDLLTGAARFHYAAILLITIAFSTLTAIAVIIEFAIGPNGGSGRRLGASMVLFLLAISFVHFRADPHVGGWSGEVALHHAAIPLALFVLLQDYRFLFADTFVRFLVTGGLAALTVWSALFLKAALGAVLPDTEGPFFLGLKFAGACLLLTLFAIVRNRVQRVLTRLVFLREGSELALPRLNAAASEAVSESRFLERATRILAETLSMRRLEVVKTPAPAFDGLRHVTVIADRSEYGCPAWVQAVVPVRLARGDACFLLRFVRKNRGWFPARAVWQVSDRARVQELGMFGSHRLFSW